MLQRTHSPDRTSKGMADMESPMEKQDRMKFTEFTVNNIMPNGHKMVLDMGDDVPERNEIMKHVIIDSKSMVTMTNYR